MANDEILERLRTQSMRLEHESYVVVAKALIAAEEIRAELGVAEETGADPVDSVIESQLRKLRDHDVGGTDDPGPVPSSEGEASPGTIESDQTASEPD